MAPPFISVPSGRHARLDYQPDGTVTAAVKLQELFGLADTPRVGPRRVPVLLALLAPNGRPVQMTRDLRSFWARTYPEVRKELGPAIRGIRGRRIPGRPRRRHVRRGGGSIEKESEDRRSAYAERGAESPRESAWGWGPKRIDKCRHNPQIEQNVLEKSLYSGWDSLDGRLCQPHDRSGPGLLRPSRRAVRGVLECLGSVRRAGRND